MKRLARLLAPHVRGHACRPKLAIYIQHARLSTSTSRHASDPRLEDLKDGIKDDFAVVREHYSTPRHPVVLAHGLFGFEELHIAGRYLPGVHYWRGITEALEAAGVSVFTTEVPASASIEERAEYLRDAIASKCGGRTVNIIAHSMGGLDARYMISRLSDPVSVASLTTIATPHRGSAVADFTFKQLGRTVPRVYSAMHALGLQTGGFEQLTRAYLRDHFNPETPDRPDVRYFSYGAALERPRLWSMFRQPYRILLQEEGPSDGLVSVESSRWGTYKGTLLDVSHLDLINWTNRLRWLAWEWMGKKRNFNALSFYLSICDMLAKEGL